MQARRVPSDQLFKGDLITSLTTVNQNAFVELVRSVLHQAACPIS